MILHVFQSDKGDCLLLEGRTSGLVLCDGGMRNSMAAVVRQELTKLRDEGRELDYVYVSHIDSDHVSGVLQLLEDEVAWRVFEVRQQLNHPGAAQPTVPRPPVIKGLLQNSFSDLIGVNNKDVSELLAVAVPSLFATSDPGLVEVALELQDLAVSIPEAISVSKLVAADALDIPVNRLPGSTGPARLLIMQDQPVAFRVGSMRFTLVGPGHEELSRLKQGWVTWLRANQTAVRALRRELRRRVEDFSTGVDASPFDLRGWNGIPDVEGVTAPNVASMMFMVEEAGRRLLLTGDGQPDVILAGLRAAGFLGDEGLHVDVLKVPHHGSENNLDVPFARAISARHYVFCGNGLHGNPDTRVIDRVFQSRLGAPEVRTLAPDAEGEAFHFWFSTTAAAQTNGSERQRVLAELEAHCARLSDDSQGRLQLHYNEGASIPLEI